MIMVPPTLLEFSGLNEVKQRKSLASHFGSQPQLLMSLFHHFVPMAHPHFSRIICVFGMLISPVTSLSVPSTSEVGPQQ